MADTNDYDMQAAIKAGVKPDERGHYPDTYKRPNHMTFSDESVYSGKGGEVGGKWEQVGGKWQFTPSATNLKYHSKEELVNYFKKYEPDSKLILAKDKQMATEKKDSNTPPDVEYRKSLMDVAGQQNQPDIDAKLEEKYKKYVEDMKKIKVTDPVAIERYKEVQHILAHERMTQAQKAAEAKQQPQAAPAQPKVPVYRQPGFGSGVVSGAMGQARDVLE